MKDYHSSKNMRNLQSSTVVYIIVLITPVSVHTGPGSPAQQDDHPAVNTVMMIKMCFKLCVNNAMKSIISCLNGQS